MTEYNEYEDVSSGASLSSPISAGSIKKGGYMIMNGRPCRV